MYVKRINTTFPKTGGRQVLNKFLDERESDKMGKQKRTWRWRSEHSDGTGVVLRFNFWM